MFLQVLFSSKRHHPHKGWQGYHRTSTSSCSSTTVTCSLASHQQEVRVCPALPAMPCASHSMLLHCAIALCQTPVDRAYAVWIIATADRCSDLLTADCACTLKAAANCSSPSCNCRLWPTTVHRSCTQLGQITGSRALPPACVMHHALALGEAQVKLHSVWLQHDVHV
jgi:hypothetical protein